MEKKISESRPPSDVGDFLGPQLDSCYLLSKYSKAHEFTIDTIVISYLYHIYIIFISYLYHIYQENPKPQKRQGLYGKPCFPLKT